jgi:hypothetical protein
MIGLIRGFCSPVASAMGSQMLTNSDADGMGWAILLFVNGAKALSHTSLLDLD